MLSSFEDMISLRRGALIARKAVPQALYLRHGLVPFYVAHRRFSWNIWSLFIAVHSTLQ
jgi:hypothetical protein